MDERSLIARLRARARELKRDTLVLYYACRDARTPWYTRLFTAAVVAYALSPIDLIPDFIPVLGYLDDIVIVPLGLTLALRLVPAPVIADCRARAAAASERPASGAAAVVIVLVWIVLALVLARWLYGLVA